MLSGFEIARDPLEALWVPPITTTVSPRSSGSLLINASKSAFGILSDTLRLELHPFGIRVTVVEHGAIKTPAVEKTLGDVEAVIDSLPANGAALRRHAAYFRPASV